MTDFKDRFINLQEFDNEPSGTFHTGWWSNTQHSNRISGSGGTYLDTPYSNYKTVSNFNIESYFFNGSYNFSSGGGDGTGRYNDWIQIIHTPRPVPEELWLDPEIPEFYNPSVTGSNGVYVNDDTGDYVIYKKEYITTNMTQSNPMQVIDPRLHGYGRMEFFIKPK